MCLNKVLLQKSVVFLLLPAALPCRGRSFLLLAQKKRTKENAPRNPTFISPCTTCAIRTNMRNFRFARFVDVPHTD